MSGYIKLWRGWRDCPELDTAIHRDAWIWMLETACWKPTRFKVGGKFIVLERGQLCASVRQIADAVGCSKSAADRFLARLEIGTMIERNAGQFKNVITICNYNKYQDIGEVERDKSGTVAGTRAGQERDTKEEGKKGRRKNIKDNTRADEDDLELDLAQPEPVADPPPAKPAKRKRTTKTKPQIDLPDWIPVKPWVAYLEMRDGKGATPTEHALHLLIGKLEKFREQGHSPGAVLDQSTLNNWTGIYPLKDKTDDQSKANRGSSSGTGNNGYGDQLNRVIRDKLERSGHDGPDEPSGEAGRYDAGEGEEDSSGRTARVIPLR